MRVLVLLVELERYLFGFDALDQVKFSGKFIALLSVSYQFAEDKSVLRALIQYAVMDTEAGFDDTSPAGKGFLNIYRGFVAMIDKN